MPKGLSNPAGAYGGTANWEADAIPFVSAETTTTILAGQCVSVNTSGKVLLATTTVDQKLVLGVAIEDIGPGKSGGICTNGFIKSVKAQGAIAAGDLVTRSGTTAGSVASFTPAAATDIGKAVGVAVSAAASSLVDVLVGTR